MGATHGYADGVRSALRTAGFVFAAMVSTVQFLAFLANYSTYPRPDVLAAAFAVQTAVWVFATLRWVPAVALLGSWTLVGVACAVQASAGSEHIMVVPLTMSVAIAVTAALLLPLGPTLIVVVLVGVCILAVQWTAMPPVPSSLWIYPVLIPVYVLSSAAAIGWVARELGVVAERADEQVRQRLMADRTVSRKELQAKAARRRARILHDTVVNTLGVIASARIASSDEQLARRCAEDVRNVEMLRHSGINAEASLDDVFDRAAELAVNLTGVNTDSLNVRLAAEEPWRRREIVAMLRELVTNVAKHARVGAAKLDYDIEKDTVTVSDAGVGTAYVGPLRTALATRGEDAHTDIVVVSAPGRGMSVAVRIKPAHLAAAGLFEVASQRMVTGIAVVMITLFAVVNLMVFALVAGWSPGTVTPPVVGWLITALAVFLGARYAGRGLTLPVPAIAAAYLALAALALLAASADTAHTACGRPPTVVWVGDAAAAVCGVLIVADGRYKVALPAMFAIIAGSAVALGGAAARCGGSVASVLAADLFIVIALFIMRRKALRLSAAAARSAQDQLSRRENVERLAVQDALRDDGFESSLRSARDILQTVADQPASVGDTGLRAGAGREEGYLRALLSLAGETTSSAVTNQFVAVIDQARLAGVALTAYADPESLDAKTAGAVVAAIRAVLPRSRRGGEISVGVFGGVSERTVVLLASPHAVDGYASDDPDGDIDTVVVVELGLVEMRWSDGSHCRAR